MTISPVPQLLPSPQTVWAKAHIPREPQSPVPVGIGGTGGENRTTPVGSPEFRQSDEALGGNGGPTVAKPPAPELLQSNINDEALSPAIVWARQTRNRFPGCTLAYHAFDGVTQGRDRWGYLWAEVVR